MQVVCLSGPFKNSLGSLVQNNGEHSRPVSKKPLWITLLTKEALRCQWYELTNFISYVSNDVCHLFIRCKYVLMIVSNVGNEEHSCEFGSAKYYALCGFGGILSCGLTHTAVVPLDLVKCRIQVCVMYFLSLIH